MDDVEVFFDEVHGLIDDIAPAYLLERAETRIVPTAQRLAAKDTGRGAESIHAQLVHDGPGQHAVRVGPDAEHFYLSQFVELGTVHMAAQPALRPALDSAAD